VQELINYIIHNWSTVSSAPATLVILLFVAGSVAYLIARWHYEGTVLKLNEHIEVLKERMEGKDDQLDDYRERLHLIPASGTKYSRLTNEELRTESLNLGAKLRKFLAESQVEDRRVSDPERQKMVNAPCEDEKDRLWSIMTRSMIMHIQKLNNEYDQRFKVDTIILRDELASRLPERDRDQPSRFRPSSYEFPTNPIGMEMVADNLEELAKNLP
jgi:hypothetical protein